MNLTKLALSDAGYTVNNSEYLLKADRFNVAQKRIRHFLSLLKIVAVTNALIYLELNLNSFLPWMR